MNNYTSHVSSVRSAFTWSTLVVENTDTSSCS